MRWFFPSLLTVLAASAPFSSQATRLVPLTVEELSGHADVIVRGIVRTVGSARDARGAIYTRVVVQVLDVWKGGLRENPCEIVAGGGILGEETIQTGADAAYEIGEELVVFLVRNPAGEWVTVGMGQGKFRVHPDPEGGDRNRSDARMVSNPFLGFAGDAHVARTGGAAIRSMTLAELRKRAVRAGEVR